MSHPARRFYTGRQEGPTRLQKRRYAASLRRRGSPVRRPVRPGCTPGQPLRGVRGPGLTRRDPGCFHRRPGATTHTTDQDRVAVADRLNHLHVGIVGGVGVIVTGGVVVTVPQAVSVPRFFPNLTGDDLPVFHGEYDVVAGTAEMRTNRLLIVTDNCNFHDRYLVPRDREGQLDGPMTCTTERCDSGRSARARASSVASMPPCLIAVAIRNASVI